MNLKEVLRKHKAWLDDKTHGVRANLSGANLFGAVLSSADLRYANLRDADLRGANMRGAVLFGVDLRYADMRDADLRYANLSGVNLFGANMCDAVLSDAKGIPHFQLPQGELRVWKAVRGKLVHLLIPRHVRRTASLVGRKCRAQAAFVLAIEGDDPIESVKGCVYRLREWVYPDRYDDDPRVECSNGIHFFLTRAEAEEWRK